MWLRLSAALAMLGLAAEAGMVNVCSDLKTCEQCTQSYVHIFSFREHCR